MSFPEIGFVHDWEFPVRKTEISEKFHEFWMSFPGFANNFAQNCFLSRDASFQTHFTKIIHFRTSKTFQKLMKSKR